MLAKNKTMPNEMLNDVMRLAEVDVGELVDLETIVRCSSYLSDNF